MERTSPPSETDKMERVFYPCSFLHLPSGASALLCLNLPPSLDSRELPSLRGQWTEPSYVSQLKLSHKPFSFWYKGGQG
jgi:hypothetical protein